MKLTESEINKINRAKDFLRQAEESEEKIQSCVSELRRLEMLKYTIGISLQTDTKGSVAVSSGITKQSTDAAYVDVIAKIDALENKMKAETAELVDIRKRIHDVIKTAYSADAQKVLRHIYIDRMTIEKIAEETNFSPRHITRIHTRALLSVKLD